MEINEQSDDPLKLLRLRSLVWILFRLLCCAIGRHKWIYRSPKRMIRKCYYCKHKQALAVKVAVKVEYSESDQWVDMHC